MGFLDNLCNQLRDKQSAVAPLAAEKEIENHFMKGKAARTSYIQLLQFVLLLLKPYAKNQEAGKRFLDCIHKSVGAGNTLDELMTQVLECEEKDLRHWLQEVSDCGGNGNLALDALLLWQRLEAGEEGLESLTNFFTMAAIDQDVVKDAAEAAKLISGKDEKGVLMKDWHILAPEALKWYFSSWNPDEQMQLDAAVSLFMRDQVTEAYPLFLKLAKRGNRRAMYYMGEYYRFGWAGLPVNKGLGFHYHHLGAEKGEPLCQLNLAYEDGANKEKIWQETIPKVMQLAQAGDVAAEYELAEALHRASEKGTYITDKSGNVIDAAKQSEFWYEKAVKDGYWRPTWNLAERYRDDDPEKAITWYEMVYQMHGDHAGEAANNIGVIYYNQENYKEALAWYRKGIEEGCDRSMYNLGNCYDYGEGVDEDQAEAIAWYKKAYELHGKAAGDAASDIGEIYYWDQENYEEAVGWYMKSAEKGCDWGMYNLARCYRNGEGVDEDPDEAIAWYKKAYELHGGAAGDAASDIGEIYYWDQENYEEAVGWYMKSAEKGCDWGMYNLARCYRDGNGVDADSDKAIEWFKKAYELHGGAAGSAANCIGLIYDEHGEHEAEVSWYRRGIDEGHDYCMRNLGICYENGEGVTRDYEKAREWYQKAIDCHGEAEEDARKRLNEL